jgi:hypothetical protein
MAQTGSTRANQRRDFIDLCGPASPTGFQPSCSPSSALNACAEAFGRRSRTGIDAPAAYVWLMFLGSRRVIHHAVPAAVLGHQGQLDQRGDRPVSAQHRLGQLEHRIRPGGQRRVPQRYSSYTSDEQWAVIEPLLPERAGLVHEPTFDSAARSTIVKIAYSRERR